MTGLAERTALLDVIDKGRAHLTFDQIIEGFPVPHINTCPPNVPYSFWGVLEHLSICIHLSIDYAVGESFIPLEWPRQFWPEPGKQATEAEWHETIASIRAGIERLRSIAADESIDLTEPCRNVSPGRSDTILFEIVDAIDHNAYHFGEFAILRQVCGIWPIDRQS